jgi:hypothetical protein
MIFERVFYVTVGAADVFAERLRGLPVLEKLRARSFVDRIRDFEPNARKQVDELQTRGERVVGSVRTQVDRTRQSETRFVEMGPLTLMSRRVFEALSPFPEAGMAWGVWHGTQRGVGQARSRG